MSRVKQVSRVKNNFSTGPCARAKTPCHKVGVASAAEQSRLAGLSSYLPCHKVGVASLAEQSRLAGLSSYLPCHKVGVAGNVLVLVTMHALCPVSF